MSRNIPVLDEEGQQLGYLILDNELYYPYSMEGKQIGLPFFNKQSAISYLQQFDQLFGESGKVLPVSEKI